MRLILEGRREEREGGGQKTETIKKVKRGSLIYTDKFKSYDGLVMYGFSQERIDKSIRFANGKAQRKIS